MILKKKSFFTAFWLLLMFSVILLYMNLSSCYALSYEDIKEYVNLTADYFPNNSNYQEIKQKVNSADTSDINDINNMASGYNNVCIYKMDSRHYNIKVFNANSMVSNSSSITYTGNYKTIQWNNSWGSVYGPYNETNSSIDGGYSYKSNTGQENTLLGMTLLGQIPTGQLPNTFVGDQAIPKFTYLEFDNSMIDNTAYNGNLFTYYFKGNLYSQSQIKLGNIINNDSYYYECKLYDYENNIYNGSSFVAINTSPITIYNDGSLYINNNQEIFINTLLIDYSKQYRLDIVSYYGDGGTNLYEDDDWFIFLPYNASVSGDVILSLGSGDFNNQDQTIQLIDAQQQQTQDIIAYISDYNGASGEMAGFFSGNILSGDIIGGIEMPHIRTW